MRHRIAPGIVVLAAILTLPAAAPAQVPTQRGNALSFCLYATGYALGLTFPFNPALDAAFAYSTIPPFDGEIDLGVRLHLSVRTPGIDPYVGAGVTFTSAGGTSSTGLFAQGGVVFSLAWRTTGYAGLRYISSAGAAVTHYDAGVQYQLTPQVAGLVGVAGSGGTTSIYLGANVNF